MNFLVKLSFRSPKTFPINRVASTKLFFRQSPNLYPLCSLHTSLPFFDDSNSKPSSSSSKFNYEKPPVSDTIVPTPMASAFKNMFDGSAIHSIQMLSRLTNDGFITSNEIEVKGPVILLNGDLIMWDVPQGDHGKGSVFNNWTTDFLKVFEVIKPRPELLIFGTGKSVVPIPSHIRQYLNGLGIQIEIVDTRNALATFNVLAEEGRNVATALLPLIPTSARTGKSLIT
ncbi:unnamed protein product [Rhizophagus irregularis]|uniref:Uncharacterized protein n=3 Tax=Rhizophagus irregularis TaxID=588596 RepID=U9U9Q8_RHIID|nr:hypothetical protein GLOIN_2v1556657 [Rhizophagus irregularis DAOM 181602=DAOM 197198]PKY38693.1 DUF498-domain-containing protein [Rhizophagus irregularis]POG76472.1 hypothetical protein GLOIN_2v1556657 [Rhizophagus irregularis DAOM 181602=DAOM 197198]UZO17784.1 hypothetical protein OCT59_009124 [Rhizophagus irregularis]CAB4405270.1 unnamed protein product [Rhizophagus irregularis]CAB4475113.1 unnamed protein product [Rhizophagus irregularis]|eukprot:XP_025183338.1 hypothetical protein GLOIN_2v1556657 [Rhizophagus irregularis DAOM 181602=DAOM 197198]